MTAEERLTTDQGFATTARDTDSLYGIYQARVDAHAVQANLRHDDFEPVRRKTTGAIAYGLPVPRHRSVSPPSYGTGSKAPSFNDLYYPFFSNPRLVPETSRNVEGGAYWNSNVAGDTFEAWRDSRYGAQLKSRHTGR